MSHEIIEIEMIEAIGMKEVTVETGVIGQLLIDQHQVQRKIKKTEKLNFEKLFL
jgi:hypothetical protein